MRLSLKIFLMTFAVLMTTFFTTFAVIETLLPRLYAREFRRDYDQLMATLQHELINELQGELTFQIDHMIEVGMSLERVEEELTHWINFYEQECLELDLWQDWRDSEFMISTIEELHSCEIALWEIDFLGRLREGILIETEHFLMQIPMEWFHFRKMREHHQQYGSIPYLIVERTLNNFATTNNVRIWVWDIPAGTIDELGETLFYIEGRSADFITILDDTELGVREQRFHDPATGGFAIAISGTFQPAYRVLNIISALQRQLLLVMFFVSLVISLLFSRYLAHPIVALSTESKKLRKLQFDENLKIKRRDEIGDLSSNLNFMSYELKRTLDLLQDANEKLRKEMEKEREQERQRRNLFTSISHELKTPITILKGEIGGMIDEVGDYKDRDAYLGSAYKWTETLEKLVSEILTITRLEGEKMHLEMKQLVLGELVEEIIQEHMPLANNQGVQIEKIILPDVVIQADESQLKMAISNVINNAIFYSGPNEQVFVKLQKVNDFAMLLVTNTGVQIEQEALENLFNPFYRIDKSRNRHTGGSGLGLFIVKNILELHGFEYGIENVENGVQFTVKIPTEVKF